MIYLRKTSIARGRIVSDAMYNTQWIICYRDVNIDWSLYNKHTVMMQLNEHHPGFQEV